MKKSFLILVTLFAILNLSNCKSTKVSGSYKWGQPFSESKLKKNPGAVQENVSVVMPEYVSPYKPHTGYNLPVIKINSNSGSFDFITKPVDTEVTKFLSQWGKVDNPAPYFEDCTITVLDDKNKVSLDKVAAKVKVRGNWTSNFEKKGVRIKFDEEQSLLGLHNDEKFDSWILAAEVKDWTFMRDATAYYMSKLISPDYTTDFRLVNIFVNDKYWGVYLLAESQEVTKRRINLTKPKKGSDSTDIGYLLEIDFHAHEDENNFQLDYKYGLFDYDNKYVKDFITTYTINNKITDSKQVKFIENYMNLLWELCYKAVYTKEYMEFNEDNTKLVHSKAKTCYECISKVINLESLVNTYILHELCCDADFYLSSFYMDLDFGAGKDKRLKFEAPWDFDSALGNKKFCETSEGLFAGVNSWNVDHNARGVGNPWFLIFINCSWFQDLVRQKWQQIMAQDIANKVLTQIDTVSSLYKSDFEKNQDIWKNVGNKSMFGYELCPAALACKTQRQAADYLYIWLDRRFKFFNEFWGYKN